MGWLAVFRYSVSFFSQLASVFIKILAYIDNKSQFVGETLSKNLQHGPQC